MCTDSSDGLGWQTAGSTTRSKLGMVRLNNGSPSNSQCNFLSEVSK